MVDNRQGSEWPILTKTVNMIDKVDKIYEIYLCDMLDFMKILTDRTGSTC